MLFTKELISGKDIDLTKYNLGIIKQPTVDMFMGNLEITEFMKPFYFERVLKVNKVLVEELPFTSCLMVGRENNIGKLILDSFNIKIMPDLYSKAELKQIKTKIEIL